MPDRQLGHFVHAYPVPPPEDIEMPFADLARHLDGLMNEGLEKSHALRTLLYARDQAMRARAVDLEGRAHDKHLEDIRIALGASPVNPTGDIHA